MRVAGLPADSVSWAPDGKRIALASRGDIDVSTRDGRGLVRWTSGPRADAAPDWRP